MTRYLGLNKEHEAGIAIKATAIALFTALHYEANMLTIMSLQIELARLLNNVHKNELYWDYKEFDIKMVSLICLMHSGYVPSLKGG